MPSMAEGSEDLESSGGLSKVDLVSLGRAPSSKLHTISPFFKLQTQKEGNNNTRVLNEPGISFLAGISPFLSGLFPRPSCLTLFSAYAWCYFTGTDTVPSSLLCSGASLLEVCTVLHALVLATPRWGVLPTLQAGMWEAGNMAAWCTMEGCTRLPSFS